MILGIGVDLIEIERIRQVFSTEKKQERIFTMTEIRDSKAAGFSSLAARFAAKEAFSKALGTGIRNISFKVFNSSNQRLHLSLSHDKERAYAMVIIEEGI